jgi:hypothetical protein
MGVLKAYAQEGVVIDQIVQIGSAAPSGGGEIEA